MRLNASFAAIILAQTVGCASGGGGGTTAARPALPAGSVGTSATTSAAPARATRGGANLISASEIASLAGSAQNAFEVIQRLRPAMLRSRATGGQSGSGNLTSVSPAVFVDTTPMGELSNLNSIGYDTIREIRFINASDATTMWGTGYPSGVIQVILKK